jgi:hypothetical protein
VTNLGNIIEQVFGLKALAQGCSISGKFILYPPILPQLADDLLTLPVAALLGIGVERIACLLLKIIGLLVFLLGAGCCSLISITAVLK